MRATSLLAGMLVAAGFLASAAAQETPPEKPPVAPGAATLAPSNPLGLTPEMTVEQAMDRLRGMMGGFNPFQAAGPAAVSANPDIRRGDVIVALPVAPRRVGRLTNDLVQSGAMLRRERVVMPAGTPVFFTRFQYTVTSGYGALISSISYDAWCGVVSDRNDRPRGWCALTDGRRHHVGEVIAGSPYMPSQLSGPFGGNAVTVAEDSAVRSEFPALELTHTFVEFDERDADVRRGVRVAGGEVIETNNVSLSAQADGSSLLRVAGGEFRLQRTDDRRTARLEVVRAAQSYDPEEEERLLRALATALLARVRTGQAAAPRAAPPSAPPAP